MSRRNLSAATALFSASLLATSFAHADPKSIDKVNGAIQTNAGVEYGDLSTVNGDVSVAEDSTAQEVETVNGGITIGTRARVASAETVNGGISVRADALIEGDLETVNGGVSMAAGSSVIGRVETVNGGIQLTTAQVGNGIETVSGDIEVLAGSVVKGGIIVRKPTGSWFSMGTQRDPKVVIGANSVVEGELVFERDVELLVDASAKIGKVTGATAKTLEVEK